MEFIPIEKYTNQKGKRTIKRKKDSEEPDEKLKKKEVKKLLNVISPRKIKPKPQTKKVDVKKVKNKYREMLMNKKKKNVFKNVKSKKKKEEEEDDGDEDFQNVDEEEQIEETVDDDDDEEEEEEDEHEGGEEEEEEKMETDDDDEEEEENEKKALEEKIKKRRQELDEKKKNRLFIKLKNKITNEAQIKQLHPDIKSVIYPRKKRSRWCWAVFASEQRADEALKKLSRNKEIVAAKPNPHEKVEIKREKKMKTVQRKKEARKKLKQLWM